MDLFQDLRDEVVKWLPHDQGDRSALMALNDEELTIVFFNWLERLVHPHPRTIFKSREYSANVLPPDKVRDLEQLIKKIQNGDDLTPHLSSRVLQGFAPRARTTPTTKKKLSSRKDLDLLLNEWGIHHLHLSHDVESDGFVGGDEILFAIFTPDAAYLLDVTQHGQWTNQHFVEVAVRNWPSAGLFHAMKGVIGSAWNASQSERKQLRSAGITSSVEVDGRVYLSRTVGLSASGHSLHASTRALRLFDAIEQITEKLKQNPEYLRPDLERCAKRYPA